jgi:hypothetical protein
MNLIIFVSFIFHVVTEKHNIFAGWIRSGNIRSKIARLVYLNYVMMGGSNGNTNIEEIF